MRVLITWLNLDPAAFLQPLTPMAEAAPASVSELGNLNSKRELLMLVLDELDEQSIEVLYLTALAMRNVKNTSQALRGAPDAAGDFLSDR